VRFLLPILDIIASLNLDHLSCIVLGSYIVWDTCTRKAFMRSLSLLFMLVSLYLWTGCSDKPSDGISTTKPMLPTESPRPQTDFRITDIDQRSTLLTFKNNKLTVAKVAQPIILVHLFASWSAPSCGMIPYLDTLQKSYPKTVFVIGIIANSRHSEKSLRRFMKKHHASYFISNSPDNDKLAQRLAHFLKLGDNYPVPITLLFKNGVYTMHYVGATPIEMIKADIEQLRRQ